jgi:hypothetical protein
MLARGVAPDALSRSFIPVAKGKAMRLAFTTMLFGLSLLGSGCALVVDANRNVVRSICKPIEEHQEIARNRRWADITWKSVCAAEPGSHSSDYASGFKDGYAEYLFRGGDGAPPLIAPQRYRHVKYQTPAGTAAIQDWFHGYRHGAAVARDSGARRWITGPSALQAEFHGGEPDLPPPVQWNTETPRPMLLPEPNHVAPASSVPIPVGKEPVELPMSKALTPNPGPTLFPMGTEPKVRGALQPPITASVAPSAAPVALPPIDTAMARELAAPAIAPSETPPAPAKARITAISTESSSVSPAATPEKARARITGMTTVAPRKD